MRKNQPWIVLAALLALAMGLMQFFGGRGQSWRVEEIMATQVRKAQLTAQVRADLLAAVDAGKSALLADTPDEARGFADRARQASTAVDAGMAELAAISEKDGYDRQRKLVQDAARAWSDVRAVDEEFLPLVVQKSNSEATRLSFGPGFDLMGRFEGALRLAVGAQAGKPGADRLATACFDAVANAAMILALQAPHIAEATDAGMDRIEARMNECAARVRAALAEAASLVEGDAAAQVAQAGALFGQFEANNREVLKLSRINSEVKSLALSMDRRRVAAAACETSLGELQELINARLSKATR